MIIDIFIESGIFRLKELQILKIAFNDNYDFQRILNIRKKQYQQYEIYNNSQEYPVELVHNTRSKLCVFCNHTKTKLYNPIIKKSTCIRCIFVFNISKTNAKRKYKIKESYLNRLNSFRYLYNGILITLYQLQDIQDISTIIDLPKPRRNRKEERYNKLQQFLVDANIRPSLLPQFISCIPDIHSFYHSNKPCFTKIKKILSLWNTYENQVSNFTSLEFVNILSNYINYVKEPDNTIDTLKRMNQIEYDKQSRKIELEEALVTEKLTLRTNSNLYRRYIEDPESGLQLNDVVNMMKEMEWFYVNTSYQVDLIKAIQYNRYHRYHRNVYSIDYISELLKKRLVRTRLQKNQDVPNFIQERYKSDYS